MGAAGRASFANGTWTIEGSGRLTSGTPPTGPLRLSRQPPQPVLAHGSRREHREPQSLGQGRDDGPGGPVAGLTSRVAVRDAAHRARAWRSSAALVSRTRTAPHTAGPAIKPPGVVEGRPPRATPRQRLLTGDLRNRPRGRSLDEQVVAGTAAPGSTSGLAVSSHVDGALATATLDNVTFAGRRIR